MVDIDKLRGISSSQKKENDEKISEKQKARQNQVEKGIERARPDLKGPAKEKAKEILLKVADGENVSLDKDMEDFAFTVAESLQAIENETTPMNEYVYWLEDADKVIQNMNDGDITDDDLKFRDDFLETLNVRETEMRVYLDLYRASKSPKAQEKLAALQLKLSKLQQLRSAILASTKSREEAEYERQVQENEKRIAEEYRRMLREREQELYSPLEYKASLLMAQSLIALAAADQNDKAAQLRRNRYQNYMLQRADDMRYLHQLAPNAALNKSYANQIEMMNLVKVANTSQNHGYFTEDERLKRDVCGAVLEYRRRDKDVPEKILYKLGVKSFVPDYSMSEEMLRRNIQTQSKSDVIKRINELRGRQTSSVAPKSVNKDRIQSFDINRYVALKSRLDKQYA